MGDLNLTPGQPKGSETILSEEMWDKVLTNLADPSDVLNAGKACVQFQRILHSKMVEINLAKTLPILMNYMDRQSVLKCRSVSKGWRGVVDKFLENYFLGRTILEPDEKLKPFHFAAYYCALYSFGEDSSSYSYNQNKKRGYELFIREMKDHPRNPFIGHAVRFELSPAEEGKDRQDLRTVYNFFEIFGKHIWTLNLNINWYPNQVEKERYFSFIMRDVFELVPNLKNLYIRHIPPMTVSMNMNEIRALPLPSALEKLEISEAFREYEDPRDEYYELEKAILQRHANSQLRVLHTKTFDPLRNLNNWPNLKELHFTDIKRINDLDVILRNLRVPRLEFLSISVAHMGIANYNEWRKTGQYKTYVKFFRALNHLCTLSPNLKTLRIETSYLWDKRNQALGFPRGLPCPESIKTLEIEDTFYRDYEDFGTSDYSFLLRFPYVENIRVIHVYRDSGFDKHWNCDRGKERRYDDEPIDGGGEIVKVHEFMYSGRMYESNIWELLPSLKVFSCRNGGEERVYTRSSYERRRLRKLKLQN